MLRGNAPATIDDKGRLKIPTVFRAEIEVTWGSDFYVTSVTGDSVLVYPLPVWHEYEQKLAKLPSMNSAKKKFLNRTNFYGQLTAMDKSGRILIPTILRESARMTGEVAVLGNLNNLEIWNHERFVSSIKEDGFSESDMESLGLDGNLICMHTHIPVLLDEVMQYLNLRQDGRYIDATFGAGGHTREILERTSPGGRVLAIDQDETAIAQGRIELQSYGSRLELVKTNFREIESIVSEHGFAGLDGVMADIGVSSMMLDDPLRGFSFMREGPLDMRMDHDQPLTAADVLNTYSEKEIANILFNFGEERRSRQIASSIVRCRPLSRTTDLTRAIERVLGGRRYGKIHPATRTFQALRIFVNDELRSLETFLDSSMKVLRPGGRLVLISFHSLEDRIVKNKFRAPVVPGVVLTRKVITAALDETHRNPRSRSARLRAWEKS